MKIRELATSTRTATKAEVVILIVCPPIGLLLAVIGSYDDGNPLN